MNRWSLSSTLRKISATSRGSSRLQNSNQRNRSLESLETRCLLAGDLVANWQAQELAATLADGDTVTEWIDNVSGISATNGKGTPTFVAGQFSGRAAIRFDASDEIDQLVAAANTSPISGADDFSVSVAFATSSDALAGTDGNWFDNTGIVDSNRQIFGRGWGLTMNSTGQLTTGLNSGAFGDSGMTVRSNESGLNDGGLHFATVTRSGGELAIFVDTNAPTVLSGGSDEARDPIELSIGALAGAKNGFTGDIAEVRIFNGALTADEVLGVHSDLESYYVNVPPVAADDTYTFDEDEGLFGFVQITTANGLLSNDTDTEANPLTAINVTQPAVGTVTPFENGSFTYDPPEDFFGTETFTYQAFDGQASNVATVTINIQNVYDPAVANGDSYKTEPSQLLSVGSAIGVLSNDDNPDATTLQVELVDDVSDGTLNLSSDGSFTYNSDGFAGDTSFTYRINDGTGTSNTATVNLVVNSAPTAVNDSYSIGEDGLLDPPAVIGVIGNDIDAEGNSLTATLVDDVSNGTLTLHEDGSFAYVPSENYVGPDAFTYMVSDGEDPSEVATVSITVTPVNDIPVANADIFVTLTGDEIAIDASAGVLANDTDIEGDALSASLVSPPNQGTVVLKADGSLTYAANEGFQGIDTFTYVANDGTADSEISEVTVYVGFSPLTISEFMAANATGIETRVRDEPDGRFRGDALTPDWIEIFNGTDASFDISGYHLTDSRNNLKKWAFPQGTEIGPSEYLVIYASRLSISDPSLDETGRLHTNFKLQPEGEYLAITTPDGAVLHDYGNRYPNQRPDVSYGLADSTPIYFQTSSLGESNNADGQTYTGIANDTSFSIDRGFFTEAFEVAISTTEDGGQIWFTLDGSEPSPENGTLYSTPIPISTTTNLRAATYKDGLLPSLIDSQTYVFPAEVLKQSGDGIESAPWGDSGPDWEMDPEIVNNPDESLRVTTDDLLKIPTVSLTTDWDWFFGNKGIYPWDSRNDIGVARDGYEIPVSFEYFDVEGNSTQAYSTVQIVGGSSPDRNTNDWKSDKLSMRVKFTENVGKSSLDYPVFGPDAIDSFSTLVVDARLNNVWSYSGGSEPTGQRGRALYFRDQLAADMQRDAGGYAPHGHKTHVYINGIYWGLHTLHERPDDEFAASYLGGDNDDYDIVKHTPNDVIAGSNENYNALLDAVREDMEVQANYDAVTEMLDIEDFAAYMLVNQYGANGDWAHHNWYASFNRVAPEGKWRFHSWDAEKIVQGVNDNAVAKNDRGGPTEIHFRLMRNPEYQLKYQDIVHQEFFHDGTFTTERATKLFNIRADQIGTAIRAESARWGDNQRSAPYTAADWQGNVDGYLEDYFPRRTNIVLSQLERRDAWVDEEHQPPILSIGDVEQYGGFTAAGSLLSLTAPEGTIYFTTDGSDPRMTGGSVSDTATPYDAEIAINGTTNIKARLQKADGTWSPLSNATFITNVSATADSLRINEIHYHPSDPTAAEIAAGHDDGDDFEFIEVVNISDSPIDLTNVQFLQAIEGENVEGIRFNFADSAITELQPGGLALIVEDMDAFAFRYGDGLPVAGQWSGGLGNADEPIRLVAGEDSIHEFTYLDDWLPVTDGDGPSMQIIDQAGELSTWGTAAGWRASTVLGGTPGAIDDGKVPGDSNGDGVFDSSDLTTVFQAGEYEDDVAGNSTFEEGDWNGDGDFTTRDFVFAFHFGHYVRDEVAARPAKNVAAALAEPATSSIPIAHQIRSSVRDDSEDDAVRLVRLNTQIRELLFAETTIDDFAARDTKFSSADDREGDASAFVV